LHRGRPEQASLLLRQASEANPDDARIRRHLASSLTQEGKSAEAIYQLRQAIEHSPDDPALYVELGELYLRQSQPHAAREQAILALEHNRQLAEAWLLKGRSEKAAGQLDASIDSLHRAASYDPACAETRLELADTWLKSGEPLRALTALEVHNSGFAEDQIPIPAVNLTGQALLDLKQYQRATRLLTDATTRPDATVETWISLSRAQLLAGDADSAHLTALSAQHAFPGDPAARRWLDQLALDTDPSLQASR
jgi:tetratricopeptide (TPR) repeat protein